MYEKTERYYCRGLAIAARLLMAEEETVLRC